MGVTYQWSIINAMSSIEGRYKYLWKGHYIMRCAFSYDITWRLLVYICLWMITFPSMSSLRIRRLVLAIKYGWKSCFEWYIDDISVSVNFSPNLGGTTLLIGNIYRLLHKPISRSTVEKEALSTSSQCILLHKCLVKQSHQRRFTTKIRLLWNMEHL